MRPVSGLAAIDLYNVSRLLISRGETESELTEVLDAAGLGHLQQTLAHLHVTSLKGLIDIDQSRLAAV